MNNIRVFFACYTADTPGTTQSFSSTLWTLAQLMSCNYVLIISAGRHSVHSSSPNEDILKTFNSVIYLVIIYLHPVTYCICVYIYCMLVLCSYIYAAIFPLPHLVPKGEEASSAKRAVATKWQMSWRDLSASPASICVVGTNC